MYNYRALSRAAPQQNLINDGDYMTDEKTQASAGVASDLNAELEAFGWRHMDSAPKNDIRVLILYKLHDGFHVEIGRYFEIQVKTLPQIGEDLKIRLDVISGWNTPFCRDPIAWQPLPIPTSKL